MHAAEPIARRRQLNIRLDEELETIIEDLRRSAGYPTPSATEVIRNALRTQHVKAQKKERK